MWCDQPHFDNVGAFIFIDEISDITASLHNSRAVRNVSPLVSISVDGIVTCYHEKIQKLSLEVIQNFKTN